MVRPRFWHRSPLFGLGHVSAAKAMFGLLTPETVACLLLGNDVFALLAGWTHGAVTQLIEACYLPS